MKKSITIMGHIYAQDTDGSSQNWFHGTITLKLLQRMQELVNNIDTMKVNSVTLYDDSVKSYEYLPVDPDSVDVMLDTANYRLQYSEVKSPRSKYNRPLEQGGAELVIWGRVVFWTWTEGSNCSECETEAVSIDYLWEQFGKETT
jgi:hypothetical protein